MEDSLTTLKARIPHLQRNLEGHRSSRYRILQLPTLFVMCKTHGTVHIRTIAGRRKKPQTEERKRTVIPTQNIPKVTVSIRLIVWSTLR